MSVHLSTQPLTFAAASVAALVLVACPAAAGGSHEGPPTRGVDRGHIAYATFDPVDEEGPTSIRVLDPRRSTTRTVAAFGSDPHWSPRGHLLAIGGCASADPDCDVTIAHRDGRTVRELFLPSIFPSTSTAFTPTVWSPDGRHLAGGVDSSNGDLNGLYLERSSDGGDAIRLTSNPGGEDLPGSFSPNGRWIVFVRSVLVDGDLVADGQYAVRTDGSHLHRVTPPGTLVNGEHGGRWSPDGRTILFDARPNEDSRFTLWMIRRNGHDLTRLPLPLNCGAPTADPSSWGCFAPAWSPDGHRLVFGTNDAATGTRDLYTVGLHGAALRRVTSLGTGTAADVPDWGH
jgi:Tol biopolymer transport system component